MNSMILEKKEQLVKPSQLHGNHYLQWGCVFKGFLFFFCFCFSGLHAWHMEVPRLGVQLELQLLAYTTATAM